MLLKYNSEGGQVSINDTGVGIPDDKKELIFQPFERLGHEYSDVEGSGVGLMISHKLIQAMSGNIGFESYYGEGSTFCVELPFSS